jgi:NADPH-dependent glutamate synthase beta subunit-like oxidoreductase
VVGAGPSGLACAYTLAKRGYEVSIYEEKPEAGGMMRYGIPKYRLPVDILDHEVAIVESMGVRINRNSAVNNLEELFEAGFKAVYVATGTGEGIKLQVPGEDAQGIGYAIDFLQDINTGKKLDLGQKVVVIGGGSVAMDTARSALRLGVKEVHVVCLEKMDFKSKDRMPAQEEEVREAQDEGVIFHPGHGVKYFDVENGRVRKVVCNDCLSVREIDGRFSPQCVEPTQPYELEADTVLIAIGQKSAITAYPKGLSRNDKGLVKVSGVFQTEDARVFAGGDLLTGPLDIISAIAAGNEAAESIDRFCRGEDVNKDRREIPPSVRPRVEKKSQAADLLPPVERKQCFAEVSCGFCEDTAKDQAERCLHCGSLVPSALIKREQPKKTIIPWNKNEALLLWSKRHPDSGEELPDVIDNIDEILREPDPQIFARSRLVLKPANSAEKLIYTTDDE